jgi:hypothetical protein
MSSLLPESVLRPSASGLALPSSVAGRDGTRIKYSPRRPLLAQTASLHATTHPPSHPGTTRSSIVPDQSAGLSPPLIHNSPRCPAFTARRRSRSLPASSRSLPRQGPIATPPASDRYPTAPLTTSAPAQPYIRYMSGLLGKIRALGRKKGAIVHQHFPNARNFPAVWGGKRTMRRPGTTGRASITRGKRQRAALDNPIAGSAAASTKHNYFRGRPAPRPRCPRCPPRCLARRPRHRPPQTTPARRRPPQMTPPRRQAP